MSRFYNPKSILLLVAGKRRRCRLDEVANVVSSASPIVTILIILKFFERLIAGFTFEAHDLRPRERRNVSKNGSKWTSIFKCRKSWHGLFYRTLASA
jgi:hypothetical protein